MPRRKDMLDTMIDEEIDQSFPASDPPASNAGERIGQPARTLADRAKAPSRLREKKPAKRPARR